MSRTRQVRFAADAIPAMWPTLPLDPASSTEMTLGHNVSSKADVGAVMATADAAGGVIIKPAHATFWGGY